MERVPTLVLTQLKGAPTNTDVVHAFQEEYGTIMSRCEHAANKLDEVKQYFRKHGHYTLDSSAANIVG